jgi:cytoskeletal protein CcmA (bactofilin family)
LPKIAKFFVSARSKATTMFAKRTADLDGSQASQNAPGGALGERRRSVLQDITIRGDLRSAGIVAFDGSLIGNVTTDTLVLGRNGRIDGHVRARNVTIEGVLFGAISAVHVAITASARVTADIVCQSVTVEIGSEIEGSLCCKPSSAEDYVSGSSVE